jgi:hypothetical protein
MFGALGGFLVAMPEVFFVPRRAGAYGWRCRGPEDRGRRGKLIAK